MRFRMKNTILLVAILLIGLSSSAEVFSVSFDPPQVTELHEDEEHNVTLSLGSDKSFTVSDESIVVSAEPKYNLDAQFLNESWNCAGPVCNRTFKVTGRFLGFGKVFILQKNESTSQWDTLQPPLEVTILRRDTILNHLFTIFVATVVTINYINFGCAMEMDIVKQVLRKPIGPVLGFFCQFLLMPLVSYGTGYLLFTDPVLRLGLFVFGCSPGGGASNMWTVLLEGNLNLSITMTFVSTIAAFGLIPLWVFTLGHTILEDTNIVIPYQNITTSVVSLIVPVAVGLLIQRYLPRVAAKSKRILAPVCIILIIGIIIMASIAYTYIFYLLTWSVVLAATISVWTGFLAGMLLSLAFRFSYSDTVAVSVETGIQNTGIAFVILIYSLPHPVSEIAAVVPVAASLITPIPLFVVYCFKKIRNCWFRSDKLNLKLEDAYGSCTPIINDAKTLSKGQKDKN